MIETSPESFQAWVALEGANEETIRQFKKGVGADKNASGATRLSGSRNFKPKYAPDYPLVSLHHSSPGHVVRISELREAGLIAEEDNRKSPRAYAPQREVKKGRLVWPSYERSLQDAPQARNHEGKDRSHADFEFSLISADRGFSAEEIERKLFEVSEKAKSEGFRYARHTAERAAAIVASRRDVR